MTKREAKQWACFFMLGGSQYAIDNMWEENVIDENSEDKDTVLPPSLYLKDARKIEQEIYIMKQQFRNRLERSTGKTLDQIQYEIGM